MIKKISYTGHIKLVFIVVLSKENVTVHCKNDIVYSENDTGHSENNTAQRKSIMCIQKLVRRTRRCTRAPEKRHINVPL